MKIKKNDKVLVISGKDKGKIDKVTKVLLADNKVVIENVNIQKKHIRPKREGQKGQIIQMAMPVSIANVKLLCPKCGKASRVGYKFLENKKKVRVCKKCGGEI